MTQIFKFFNSAPGDPRTYQAADFADYFGSVLSTGLLHTDNVPGMAVSVATGTLNTVVSAGKAIMKGHLYENTANTTLTHSIPEATLDRIDRIVLRLDLHNAERNIKLHVKEGVSSASPVTPALQRDNFIYEISLAHVLVRKNTVQLLAGDLVDERLDESLAGLVYSLISIPTSQFQAEWDTFMAGIEDSGFASVEELTAHKADGTAHGIGDKTALLTSNKTNLVSAINEAFQSASDGKTAVANAVTAKGVTASPSDTFPTLATKIGQISTGKKWASGVITPQGSFPHAFSVTGLGFKPTVIVLEAGGARKLYMETSLNTALNTYSYTTSGTLATSGFTTTNDGFSSENFSTGQITWRAYE